MPKSARDIPQNNRKIQILRTMAIFAVVMIHSNADGIFAVINRPFLNFAVAMFTFLSGFLTKTKIDNIFGFYKKRIAKVLIPYIIWTIFYSVITGNIINVIKNLFTAKACIPFYYILIYIQLVLLTPFVSKLLHSKYRYLGWFVSPLYIFIVRYVCVFSHIDLGFPFPESLCLAWFTYYYLGMALGNNKIDFRWSIKSTLFLYIGVIIISEIEGLLWYSIMHNFDLATTQIRLTSVATSVVACLLAYLFIKNEKANINVPWLENLLVAIGNSSFGIFFSHIAILIALKRLPMMSVVYHFPLLTIVVFLLSFAFSYTGKRILGKRLSGWLGL